jgi:hypothetical protein
MTRTFVTLAAVFIAIGINFGVPNPTGAEEQKTSTSEGASAKTASPFILRTGEKAIQDELRNKTILAFDQVPLTDVVNYIREKHHLEIQFEATAKKSEGSDPNTTLISFNVKDITLRSALHLMLAQLNLSFVIKDEVLLIITKEQADATLETVAYDVRDVLMHDDKCQPDYDSLINMLCTTIAPQTWTKQGGPGTLQRGPLGTLVVTQSSELHEQIAWLLASIRKFNDSDPVGKSGSSIVFGAMPADEAIRNILLSKVNLNFDAISLAAVLDDLRQTQHVKFYIDSAALKDAGVDPATFLISFTAKDITLRSALDRILHTCNLTWVVGNEVLLITTREKADSMLMLALYPIADVLSRGETAGDDSEEDPTTSQTVMLVGNITNNIAPLSWSDQGGPGTLEEYGNGALLVVSQNQEIHDRIANLLSQLRELHHKQQEEATKQPARPKEPETLAIKVYLLRTSTPNAPAMTPQEVAEVVKTLVEPKSWNQQDVYIRGVTGKLVVRQLPSIHREIGKLLSQLDAVVPNMGGSGEKTLGAKNTGGFGGTGAAELRPK